MPPIAGEGASLDWTGAAILAAAIFIGLLLNRLRQKRRGGGRSGGSAPGGSRRDAHGADAPQNTSGNVWRKSVGVLRQTVATDRIELDEQSPGRFGLGATRDLEPAEIRALRLSYSPELDGQPDPGEVVWTWVPYTENDGRGKDRPVLIIARIDDHAFAGCYLSTKAHRDFVSIGTGGWDAQGRESFLSPERVLRIETTGMRREGQVLSRARFEQAVVAVARHHGIKI